jgi:hypothetical protein
MMARNTNVPFKGRIQKRKTNYLQIITFGLQRAAGPYSRANCRREHMQQYAVQKPDLLDHLVGNSEHLRRNAEAQCLRGFNVNYQRELGRL